MELLKFTNRLKPSLIVSVASYPVKSWGGRPLSSHKSRFSIYNAFGSCTITDASIYDPIFRPYLLKNHIFFKSFHHLLFTLMCMPSSFGTTSYRTWLFFNIFMKFRDCVLFIIKVLSHVTRRNPSNIFFRKN